MVEVKWMFFGCVGIDMIVGLIDSLIFVDSKVDLVVVVVDFVG